MQTIFMPAVNPPPNFQQPTSTTQQKSNPITLTPGQPTTYEANVAKYAPGQAFSYSSVEGKYIPVGNPSGSAGTVTYSQIPKAAQVQLEQGGIISAEAPPPSGASYAYKGFKGTYDVSYTPPAKETTVTATPTLAAAGGGMGVIGGAAGAVSTTPFAFGGGRSAASMGVSPALSGASDVQSRITDVSIAQLTSKTGQPYLAVTGLPLPKETTPGVKPVPSGFTIPLPGATEKEAAISKATEAGYTSYLASVPALPGISPLSKGEYVAAVRPSLESQYSVNLQSAISSPEMKSASLAALSSRDITAQRNIAIMATPEYKLQAATTGFAAPTGSEVTRQLQSPFGKFETGQSAVGPFASKELLGSSIGYAAKDVGPLGFLMPLGGTRFLIESATGSAIPSAQKEAIGRQAISTRLALESAYPQAGAGEQYLQGLGGTLSLGLYTPPTSSARALFASQAPVAQLPAQAGETGLLAGGLTLAPAYITGAARGLGAATGAFEVGEKALTAGKLVQYGIGAAAIGLTAGNVITTETQTIPKILARGEKPGEIAGVREQLYGGILAGAAGAAFGAYAARSYLNEQVTPSRFTNVKGEFGRLGESPTGQLTTGEGKYIGDLTVGQTRGEIISRSPLQTISGVTFDVKEGQVFLESPQLLTKGVKTEFTIPEGEKSALVSRRIDFEAARPLSMTEQVVNLGGKEYPLYQGVLERGGTFGAAKEEYQVLGLGKGQGIANIPSGGYSVETPVSEEKFVIRTAGFVQGEKTSAIYGLDTLFTKKGFLPASTEGGGGFGLVPTEKGGMFTLVEAPSTPANDIISAPSGGGLPQISKYTVPSPPSGAIEQTTAVSRTIGGMAGELAGLYQTPVPVSATVPPAAISTALLAPQLKTPQLFNVKTTGTKTQGVSLQTKALQTSSLNSYLANVPALTTASITTQSLQTPLLQTPALSTASLTTQLQIQSLQTPAVTSALTAPVLPPPVVPGVIGPPLPPIPYFGGGGEGGRRRLSFGGLGKGVREKKRKREENVGFLSEGISKALFGKATVPKGKVKKGGQLRAVFSGSSELEKRGLNVGGFLEKGGFASFKKKFL